MFVTDDLPELKETNTKLLHQIFLTLYCGSFGLRGRNCQSLV